MLTGCDKKSMVVLILIIMAACSMGTLFVIFRSEIHSIVIVVFDYVSNNTTSGMMLYMLIYIGFKLFMMPATLMTLCGAYTFGSIYGPLKGFFICWSLVLISATIGSILAFCFGRFFLRNLIRKHLIQKVVIFDAIDKGVSKNGLKMVVLLRMNPVIPYNVLNYAMCVTSVTLKDFAFGCVGMLPLSGMWVYIGINLHSIQQLIQGNYKLGSIYSVAMASGGIILMMMCWIMVRASKAELSKLLNEEDSIKKTEIV